MSKPDDLLSVDDAALLTGADDYRLRNDVLRMRLPAYLNRDRRLMVSLREVRAWLARGLNHNQRAYA